MKTIVRKNTWVNRELVDAGWGNGYVIIPQGHPLHGKDYDEIHEMIPTLSVNGGLTYSDTVQRSGWEELENEDRKSWVIGFDTMHYRDGLSRWSKRAVENETNSLLIQLLDYLLRLENKK